MSDLFLVFDVESIGLHGEGFAAGYVVVKPNGEEVSSLRLSCPPETASGTEEGYKWVADNCPDFDDNCRDPKQVRAIFWERMVDWKNKGAIIVTDCGWPVEANFLSACIKDDPSRTWNGPYPLHDLASVILAAGGDPLATNERAPDEMPAHCPLADARQSARLLTEHLRELL